VALLGTARLSSGTRRGLALLGKCNSIRRLDRDRGLPVEVICKGSLYHGLVG
jgi:hypothetical protein